MKLCAILRMRDNGGQLQEVRVDSGVKIASVLYCSQRSDILSFLFWCLRIMDQLSIEGVKVLLINNGFPSSLVFELEAANYTHTQRRIDIEASEKRTVELLEQYPFFSSAILVVSEFKLILGEDIETKFEESWEKYYPIINTCGGNCESQSECSALQVINKKLRPNGPASKAQGAFSFYKPGTSVDNILSEKTFAEPRLAIFTIPENPMECTYSQGLIIAERTVLLKIDDLTVSKGLFYLIALYYVYFINYPSSCTAYGLLLFIQEVLLGVCENNLKKSTKYSAFIDSIYS